MSVGEGLGRGGLERDAGDFIFVSLGRESFYTCKSKLVIMVIISLEERTSCIKEMIFLLYWYLQVEKKYT